MGEFTTLMARDGHEFQAWLAAPKGAPRGAVWVAEAVTVFESSALVRRSAAGIKVSVPASSACTLGRAWPSLAKNDQISARSSRVVVSSSDTQM